jgi:type II secretory pathway component PulF
MIGYLWFLRVIGVALAVLSAASAVMNFAYRDDRLWRLASARLPFNMTIVTPILRKMGGNDYMRELEALQTGGR